MRWEQARQLPPKTFRRLVGVTPAVFEQMREAALAGEAASSHPAGGGRRGPKPKLEVADRLLLLLMYYREYRTFAHIGASFEVSEAQAWRIVSDLETRLLKDGRFHLERKQSLRSETHWQGVVVDVGECACERPKKSSAPATQARRSATR
jgi:hypothetical protein